MLLQACQYNSYDLKITVWFNMAGFTTIEETGKRKIALQNVWSQKVFVSACLVAKANGNKLPLFIVSNDT